jgi:hypothetical protein
LSLHLIPLCALGSAIFFLGCSKHLVLQKIQSGRLKAVGKWLGSNGALCFMWSGMVLINNDGPNRRGRGRKYTSW